MPDLVATSGRATRRSRSTSSSPTPGSTSRPTASTWRCASAAARGRTGATAPGSGEPDDRPLRRARLPRRPRRPATLDDLSDHDLILSRERLGAAPVRLSDGQGREGPGPPPAVRATDYATVLRLTRAGAGIGHIPSLVAARALKEGALVPVLPDWASRGGVLRAVSLAGRELPARVRLFRDHVRLGLAAMRGRRRARGDGFGLTARHRAYAAIRIVEAISSTSLDRPPSAARTTSPSSARATTSACTRRTSRPAPARGGGCRSPASA